MLSSHEVDSHQMYIGALVVGKASTFDRDFAHPSPNFHMLFFIFCPTTFLEHHTQNRTNCTMSFLHYSR